jgi:hypothetical protein
LDGSLGFEPRVAFSQIISQRIQNLHTENLVLPGGGGCGPCPDFVLYLAFKLQLRKITENHSQGI